ncbi:hypothetical protein EDB80DRAFT_724040 [Ilyonectria destructans]|nr:hypothetical protein EDB80DRAFT_724040 [Ilyonectria destructans]
MVYPDDGSSNLETSAQSPPRNIESVQDATPVSQPTDSSAHRFPPSFNLYRDSITSGEYLIGTEKKQPLYLFVSDKWHSPEIVLYSGLKKSCQMLASASWGEADSFLVVGLPPVPGTGSETTSETMKNVRLGSKSNVFQFSIEVEPANTREKFAWRPSQGDAVKGLGGESGGWELVHISQDRLRSFDTESLYTVADLNTDIDGNEVVAVWALAKGSLTKTAKFQFVGTGSSGKLGERWMTIAVITFCALFERKKRGLSASVFLV